MADVLRIKRRAAGGAAGAPASLAAAELAYNEQDDTLYYGKGNSGGAATSILAIGGPGAFQPKDADLTALAALTGTGIYYRSAADTWSPVTIGSGLSFSGGVLSATGGGSGNVSSVGTPADNQLAVWTGATTIEGDPHLLWTGTQLYAEATLHLKWPNPALYLNKTASGQGSYIVGMNNSVARWQMQLGDAAAEGTDPAGSDFSLMRCNNAGAVLDYPIKVTRANGQVALNPTVIGHTGNVFGNLLEVHSLSAATESVTRWSSDANGPLFALRKAKSGAIGNLTGAVVANDIIGDIEFNPSYNGGFGNGIRLRAVADDAVFGAPLTNATHLEYWTATSAGQTFSEKIRFYPSGGVDFDRASPADPGTGGIKAKWKGITDGSSAAAGYVGEALSATSSGVNVPAASFTPIVSLTLTPGDWDVWGSIACGITTTSAYGYVNLITTSGVTSTVAGETHSFICSPNGDIYISVPTRRFNVTVNTTIYINMYMAGSSAANGVSGVINARRRR